MADDELRASLLRIASRSPATPRPAHARQLGEALRAHRFRVRRTAIIGLAAVLAAVIGVPVGLELHHRGGTGTLDTTSGPSTTSVATTTTEPVATTTTESATTTTTSAPAAPTTTVATATGSDGRLHVELRPGFSRPEFFALPAEDAARFDGGTLSANGDGFYVLRGRNPADLCEIELYRYDRVATTRTFVAHGRSPVYSRDGRSVAFARSEPAAATASASSGCSASAISVIDVAAGRIVDLTEPLLAGTSTLADGLAWSMDGTRIGTSLGLDASETVGVAIVDVAAKHATRVVVSPELARSLTIEAGGEPEYDTCWGPTAVDWLTDGTPVVDLSDNLCGLGLDRVDRRYWRVPIDGIIRSNADAIVDPVLIAELDDIARNRPPEPGAVLSRRALHTMTAYADKASACSAALAVFRGPNLPEQLRAAVSAPGGVAFSTLSSRTGTIELSAWSEGDASDLGFFLVGLDGQIARLDYVDWHAAIVRSSPPPGFEHIQAEIRADGAGSFSCHAFTHLGGE